MHEALISDHWAEVLSAVAAHIDLNQTAYDRGAFRQARGVPDASTLLRLALAWGACGLSLRETCAWAEASGIARLSDPALVERLSRSPEWLGDIVNALLKARTAAPERQNGYRLCLVDGTSICHPGADRTSWRLHMRYDLEAGRLDTIELTDNKGAESLDRYKFQRGDIVLADAGYPKPGDLRPVIEGGGHLIVRIGWNSLRLLSPEDGSAFDLFAALRRIPGDQGEFVVRVDDHRPDLSPLLLRVVVWRKDEKAREISRRRVRKRAQKVGKTADARTLEAADYVLLLSSLPPEAFTTTDVLALYRFRWQIELAFKRLKSLLDLGNLPAKGPPLAKAWIYAKLIAALMIEDQTAEVLDFPPCADDIEPGEPFPLADHEGLVDGPQGSNPRPNRLESMALQHRRSQTSSQRTTAKAYQTM